ncbi:MAG: hypothetical protein J6K53_02830 [Roseburia sp.]|nr:hypothetical protein [Roseburia sp.]
MTELIALKKAIAEEKFNNEPLALAILYYLSKRDPEIYHEILYEFDKIIDKQTDLLIKEQLDI